MQNQGHQTNPNKTIGRELAEPQQSLNTTTNTPNSKYLFKLYNKTLKKLDNWNLYSLQLNSSQFISNSGKKTTPVYIAH